MLIYKLYPKNITLSQKITECRRKYYLISKNYRMQEFFNGDLSRVQVQLVLVLGLVGLWIFWVLRLLWLCAFFATCPFGVCYIERTLLGLWPRKLRAQHDLNSEKFLHNWFFKFYTYLNNFESSYNAHRCVCFLIV